MYWYLKVLSQYADFSGRASRKEFWMFILFDFIFTIVASIIDTAILGTAPEGYGPVFIFYTLATIVPHLAVASRRLQDVGKSSWMLFLVFIPFVGTIWLFVLFVKDSEPRVNKYGPRPIS